MVVHIQRDKDSAVGSCVDRSWPVLEFMRNDEIFIVMSVADDPR